MIVPLEPGTVTEADGVSFVTIAKGDPKSIANAIEMLIAMLDAMDTDPDIEESGDSEPSLGWHDEGSQAVLRADERDFEPELGSTEEIDQVRRLQITTSWLVEDGEPDLGFVGHGTGWRGEETDDREEENEHRDDSDYEPNLGRLETIHQGRSPDLHLWVDL